MARHFLPPVTTLAVLLSLPLAPTTSQAQQTWATEREVCLSPTFGATLQPTDSIWGRCIGVPTVNPSQSEMFWAPAQRRLRPTGCSNTSSPLTVSIPSTIRVFTLFNINPGRTLRVNGTNADEILIGSPNANDVLQGSGGKDTYVIGGLHASLTATPPDSVQGISRSPESDSITFGDNTEFVYINPGSNGQGNPGSLSAPLGTIRTPSGADVPIRGSDALPGSLRPTSMSCQSSLPWSKPLLGASRFPLLAQAPAPAQPRGPWPAAQPLGLVSQRIRPTDPLESSPCSSPPCQGTPEPLASSRFPGAPTLVGLGLTTGNRDLIILPSAGFRFQGKPILEAFPPGRPIPVLLVDHGRFLPPRVVSPSTQKLLQSRSRGLAAVRSMVAPLVYFRQNGLLVFSQNSQPLGSSGNPGVVIAVLLDRQGRPLMLQGSGEPSLYRSRFLSFAPPPRSPD
ncbi:MAG: hypothetical protein ACK46L_07705 [Synechococcaceae cyanobacterium]|jgi:hypothetical protein